MSGITIDHSGAVLLRVNLGEKQKEETMTKVERKKPQAGEWWEDETGEICHIIGIRADGRTVLENEPIGMFWKDLDTTGWTQIEGCDSFEWPKQDWVEITDPDHALRRGVDFLQFQLSPKQSPKWYAVDQSAGCAARELGCKIRCLRVDLPVAVPASPETKTVTLTTWLVSDDGKKWRAMEGNCRPESWMHVHAISTRDTVIRAGI
jgi:hypothetical protein